MNQPKTVPAHLMQDRHWRGTIHIFLKNEKLKYAAAPYVDLEEGVINSAGLKKISKPWSQSEKFMLNLALHLHGLSAKIDLSDMDYLDANNKAIAIEAIKLRFSI
ncbi:hypothetical protein ABIE27_004050 [Paenibacillus sp. 4624]|uniref:hypothetical protein n=1 Tax=Paenibacillus sp. 4624 TaxID=3156453 RepID=UPI003D1C80F4